MPQVTKKTAEIFNERHENSNVHRKYVLELVAKFRETGSVANKKRNIENPIRNEAIEVRTVCGVSRRTVQRILKAHSFHPYKIHLLQELNEDDFDRRLQFCEEMNVIDPALTAIIENQNDRRYIANRLMFQQDGTPPHYALRVRQYLDQTFPDRWIGRRGDFFMWGHLKSKIYATQPKALEDLRQRIVNECLQITPQILQNVRLMFQQDGAPPHYALRVRQYLEQSFPDRWIGRRGAIEWPPRSPDLSLLDFFMWGHLKSKIYATQPTSLEDLRQIIVNYSSNIAKCVATF
ncbi:unnamed protein product [Acanthoscelides obtectus]|uniref:Transposase n=1 Tax=Acanthoscelides obtectus TaxID=200917 RepID=A0A9P0PMC3_ACAOB|nr:unnamed protein product [Acanthoscelides obtectus]CAK1670689.1 hypothetical protein AOBTE_LOCUS27765 [Acanthoscelides obtectus]